MYCGCKKGMENLFNRDEMKSRVISSSTLCLFYENIFYKKRVCVCMCVFIIIINCVIHDYYNFFY